MHVCCRDLAALSIGELFTLRFVILCLLFLLLFGLLLLSLSKQDSRQEGTRHSVREGFLSSQLYDHRQLFLKLARKCFTREQSQTVMRFGQSPGLCAVFTFADGWPGLSDETDS